MRVPILGYLCNHVIYQYNMDRIYSWDCPDRQLMSDLVPVPRALLGTQIVPKLKACDATSILSHTDVPRAQKPSSQITRVPRQVFKVSLTMSLLSVLHGEIICKGRPGGTIRNVVGSSLQLSQPSYSRTHTHT